MIAYIDENKDEFGVEPICRELPIAPQTYYAAKDRPPSKRSISDEETVTRIHRVHTSNYGVYGVRKVHAQLRRDGPPVAWCTVERLMRREGLRGISRRKGPRTTIPGPFTDRPGDLVDRRFTAPAAACLWVADITYIRTCSGWVYAAFILDVFSRRIVGWQLSTSLHTELALDALEMGIWTRERAGRDLSQLIHHSDRGVQGGFNRSSQHLDHGGVQGWRRRTGARRPVRSRRVRVGSGVRIGRCARRCGRLDGLSPRGRCSGSSGV